MRDRQEPQKVWQIISASFQELFYKKKPISGRPLISPISAMEKKFFTVEMQDS